jgi:hypothetical protein
MSYTSEKWRPSWKIYRFNDEDGKVAAFTKAGHSVSEAARVFSDRLVRTTSVEGNLLLNGGINILWNVITGVGISFNNAHSRLGVGTDNTAANATQTQLNPTIPGSVYFQSLDATYPQINAQTIIYQATYDGSIANFTWQEFGVDNDIFDGTGSSIISYLAGSIGLLNRLVIDQGTKTIGQTWVLVLSIQLS